MTDSERLQHIVNRVDSSPWTGAFGGEDADLDDVKWLVNKYDGAIKRIDELLSEMRWRQNTELKMLDRLAEIESARK